MQTLVVCAAIIRRGEQVLIAQRKAAGEQGLLWEFPGGKLIPGESPAQCLVREINEELAMRIEVEQIFEVVSHCYDSQTQILLLAYLCKHVSGEGKAVDCQDFHWVYPCELGNYKFAEADMPLVAKFQQQFA